LAFIYIDILTGLLISFKVIGLTLYIALVVKLTFSYFKLKPAIAKAQLASIITIPIAMLVTIQWVVFGNISNQNILWYNDVFTLDEIVTTLFNHIQLLNWICSIYSEQVQII
jgi:hypothetical protein